MKQIYIGEVISRFRVAILLVVGAILTASGIAQPLGPVITIPIEKVREPYLNWAEDGNGKSCGVRLYGEWPAYLNYTNRTSYTIYTPGLQSIPSPQNSVTNNGRFRFFCYFNGISTPFNDAVCPTEIGTDLPDWYVEVRRRGPIASFTTRALAPVPGDIEFTSVSTDPEGEPVLESWNMGDGTTRDGASLIHRYTQPGNFTVRLTVTDTDALTNLASRTVTVPAPRPIVAIRLLSKHTGNRIEIDEVFTVRVTVRATDDGVGPLSNLAFTAPPLTIPNLFSNLSGTVQTNIGTLQPGEEREFDWTLRADNAGQFALVAAGVRGQDAIGRTVTGASAVANGQVTALIAAIEQRPSRVVIGGDNNGDGTTNDLDQLVELVVGITNVSRQVVTEVKAVIVDDPIQLTSLAQDLNIWFFPTNVPPGDFGTIAPGAANGIRRTNVYVATDRTYAEASILLQGKVGDAGVQARGEGLVTVGGETLIEARFDVEDRPYMAGQVVRVFGTLRNVSRFKNNRGEVIDEGKTVGVVIYPTIEGNGALGYAFLKGSGGRTPDGPTPFLVAPDEEIEISAIIPTAEVPRDGNVTITYRVDGYVHGEGPTPRRARPGEIEVVEKVTEGWSARHVVGLAGVPLVTDPWLVCPTDLAVAEYLSCRFTIGLGSAAGGMVDLAAMVGSGIGEIGVGVPRLAAWHAWAVEQALKGLTDPAARDRLAQEMILDLEAIKQVGVETLSTVELSAANIGPSIEQSIISTGRLLESGDLKLIAGAAAELAGENIDMPLEALVAARTARKAALISHGADSAAKEALQEQFERQARELAGEVDDLAARGSLRDLSKSDSLPTGVDITDDPRVYRDAFNLRKSVADRLRGLAKQQAISLFWKNVSQRAFQLLDAGTHLLRKGGVSVNTVSEIDRRFLGVPDRFVDECVIAEPPIPWISPENPAFNDIANNYLNRFPELTAGTEASQLMRAQVYERLRLQMDEWPTQVEQFIKHSQKGIVVDPATAQGGVAGALLGKPGATRAARVETFAFDDPYTGKSRNAYRLLMDDGAGNFKPLTGQADVSVFLNPDGTMPSLPKRLQVIRNLAKVGMVSTDLFADTMEGVRKSIVENIQAKRMLAATPDGRIVTTRYRDNLSIIEGGRNPGLLTDRKSETAFMEGAISEVNSLERDAPDTLSEYAKEQVSELFTPESLLEMVTELKAESDRQSGKAVRIGEDGLPEVYESAPTNTPVSLLSSLREYGGVRAAANGPLDMLAAELQKLSAAGWVKERKSTAPGAAGGRWRPATIEEVRGGPPGSGLRYAPYTYLNADVRAGTSILPILSSDELGVAPEQPFFAVGDRIVIDPGGSREEFAFVTSILPFKLSRPLQFAQEAGTMVLFLSGISDPKFLPGALPAQENLLVWLRSDAGVSVTNGTNVISWTDQSGNGFVFSAPSEATRPAWVTDATSGIPAIRFAGSATPRLQGNLERTLTNATIFTLCRFNTTSGTTYAYAFGTRDFSGLMMTLARRDGDGAYHYDGAAERMADNTIPGTDFRVFSQVYGEDGPDRHRMTVNAQTVLNTRTTTGRAYSAVATNVVLGKYVTSTFGMNGEMVEWLVYDRVLNVDERFAVEEYLRQRAGLAPFVTPGSMDLSSSDIFDYDITAAPEVSWSSDSANRELVQTGVGDPSLALSGFAGPEQVIRTKLTPNAGSGALGVVFGFQHRGMFHLFDWRQTASNHVDWGMAPAGMRLRSFHLPAGQEPTGADLWSGLDPDRVTTWRTNVVPWVAGREYEVVIRLGEDQTVVEVNFGASNLETWVVPELGGVSGQFGHYVNSMAGARFGPAVLPGAAPVITHVDVGDNGTATLRWMNGLPPYVLESAIDLSSGAWHPAAPAIPSFSQTIQTYEPSQYIRVRSAGVVPDGSDEGDGRSQTFGNSGGLWLVRATGPTRIEAENFDEGGEGIAYHDANVQNAGGLYRATAVDIYATAEFGGGHTVGSIAVGEWLDYTIKVEVAGVYRFRARTARGTSGNSALRFLLNGTDVTGNLVVPPTGNADAYATVESEPVQLAAGPQILRVDMTGGSFNLNWIEIVPVVPIVQTTFGNNGNPWTVGSLTPTRIEAENFDEGGPEVAYHETTPQNAGGVYRAEAVDVYTTTNSGGGYTVSATVLGEWLEYTIYVEQAGSFRLRARTARGASGTRTVRFLFDGVDKTGNLVIPATGNWESYATVESGRFDLAAGTQIVRVDMTSSDFNLNWFELVPVVPLAQSTFGNNGNPWSVNTNGVTRIEAENFDEGGPEVAYHDVDSINQLGGYRSEDVDVGTTTDVAGGFYVGAIVAGEWLEYTINVATPGTYQIRFRAARAPAGSSTLRVLVDGVDKTGNVTIPRTVGSQTFTTVTKTGVALEAGIQRMRVEMVVGDFNLNWIEIAP